VDLRGKKFLVIGGAGLIGSHCVDALVKEDIGEIRIYDNFTRGREENIAEALRDPRVKVFEHGGDITHWDTLARATEGVDGVFHLAALWLLHCWEYPRSAFEVNIAGTFNVLEACIEKRVKRLVYSSSASVYGDAVEEPMTEDHPYNNNNFYGATKIAGEQMCRALHHRYQSTDRRFDYVGLRYMNVYGPRQDYRGAYMAVIMKMLDSLDRGEPPVVYGDGSQAYDFVYVGDCGLANVCAMKADATDAFYNVGSGVKTTIKQLAQTILQVTGSKLSIRYESGGQTFVKNRVGSTARAERDLEFGARVSLREGLLRLIEWRKRHKEQVAQRRAAAGTAHG
jgi:UDP-glucose 4-epimerase